MATHFCIFAWKIPWRDGGANEATVHGVTKSRTQLSDFIFFYFLNCGKISINGGMDKDVVRIYNGIFSSVQLLSHDRLFVTP